MSCNAHNHPPDCKCGWGGTYYGYGATVPATYLTEMNRLWANEKHLRNANCPACGAAVYFYEASDGGRAFFDEIGPPWPKHPCTDILWKRGLGRPWVGRLSESFYTTKDWSVIDHVCLKSLASGSRVSWQEEKQDRAFYIPFKSSLLLKELRLSSRSHDLNFCSVGSMYISLLLVDRDTRKWIVAQGEGTPFKNQLQHLKLFKVTLFDQYVPESLSGLCPRPQKPSILAGYLKSRPTR